MNQASHSKHEQPVIYYQNQTLAIAHPKSETVIYLKSILSINNQFGQNNISH